MMFKRFVLIALLLGCTAHGAWAALEQDTAPSAELLEFLADWSEDDGRWLNPLDLEDMNLPDEEQREDDTQD